MICTVGHSTRSADELVEILRDGVVSTLVDVRSFPGSRRYPHFGTEALARRLADVGIGYEWEPRLGGRRRSKAAPTTGWKLASFAAYAEHMGGEDFLAAIGSAVDRFGSPADPNCALMCSEAVWWRCHRGMIADWLTAHGVPVLHLPEGELHADVIGDRLDRYRVQERMAI